MRRAKWYQPLEQAATVLASAVISSVVFRACLSWFVFASDHPTSPKGLTIVGEIFFCSFGFACGAGFGLIGYQLIAKWSGGDIGSVNGIGCGILLGVVAGVLALPIMGITCITLPSEDLFR